MGNRNTSTTSESPVPGVDQPLSGAVQAPDPDGLAGNNDSLNKEGNSFILLEEEGVEPPLSEAIQAPDGLAGDNDSLNTEGILLEEEDETHQVDLQHRETVQQLPRLSLSQENSVNHVVEEKELKKRLFEHYALLEEAALAYVRNRKETIKLLKSLADELTTHHSNAQAAKISGGVAGIVGSGLAIAGFAASFFTFGASLGLVAAGAAVGAVGGLTAVGGIMTELISSKLTSNKAKEILQQDNNSCNLLIEAIESVDTSYRNLLTTVRVSGGIIGGGKNVFNVVNSVADMVKVSAVTVEAAEGVGKTAFRAATAAGKGAAIAGVVFSVVTIPVDLYMIISSAKYLHKKTIPQVAQGIYGIVEEMDCPSEKAVQISISEMKCRQLKFLMESETP